MYMKKNTQLFKKNARPKKMLIQIERMRGGKYHVVGAEYLNEVNQYSAQWRRLDVRNVVSELRRAATGKRKLTVN